MTERFKYKNWAISKNGNVYFATDGKGFFTGYHTCSCPGAFLDVLNSTYSAIGSK